MVLALVFTGCSAPKEEVVPEKEPLASLKIGLMPAVDTAPIFVARDKGYFEDLGLDVSIEVFTNAQDRQTALQTGQIDGAMSDLVALIMNVQGGFDIKGTTLTDGMFPILVRKDFKETENISVAMMEVSVSNYLADQWLGSDYQMEKIFINEIPARLEMIKNGKVDMGVFPEPVASMGELDGLEKRIYPLEEGYCPDIFVFTGTALKEKESAIKAFHQALDQAVEDIEKDDKIARAILVSELGFNPKIESQMALPTYQKTHLPDEAYLTKVIEWTAKTLGKEITVTPDMLVERKFTK